MEEVTVAPLALEQHVHYRMTKRSGVDAGRKSMEDITRMCLDLTVKIVSLSCHGPVRSTAGRRLTL